jgi:adenine-specific DNA-methyltransferase
MVKIHETLASTLRRDPRLVSQEGHLLKNKIQELAAKNDPSLLKMLLEIRELRETFFVELKDFTVFDRFRFVQFISNKEFLPNSFTTFKNKVGLSSGDSYLREEKSVVLSWPYKDCVLQGGMTKEDQKRDEVFFNEILAPDEVTSLLSPKALGKFQKYIAGGIEPVAGFARNAEGTITENLIIKGNNLLALASLVDQFEGKVKLIYIDPPYNTENGSFNYNDSFNHSTWLTYMKNRLELARKLLSEDGSVYVNIDYNEIHYLKILMDEVFGRNNFQREIIWRMGSVSGYKTAVKNFIRNHDTILFYSKNSSKLDFKKRYIENKDFKEILPLSNELKKYFSDKGISQATTEEIFNFINHENRGERYPLEDTWNANKWDQLDSLAIESATKRVAETVAIDDENFKGQKPEKLIKRIIESSTDEGDLVVDFFLGSGTTAAAAHKLRRQYIGVEQMDYVTESVVPRLQEVIKGDDVGISKSIGWTGGGSFVYCELTSWNQKWVDKILDAPDDEALKSIWGEISQSIFLSYKVNIKTIDDSIQDFENLSTENKKKFLIETLDKNLLYVNFSDIEDPVYGISEIEKNLNQDFYKR